MFTFFFQKENCWISLRMGTSRIHYISQPPLHKSVQEVVNAAERPDPLWCVNLQMGVASFALRCGNVTYIPTGWMWAEVMLTNSRLCLKRKGHTLTFSFFGLCRWESHVGMKKHERKPRCLSAWSHHPDPGQLLPRGAEKGSILFKPILFWDFSRSAEPLT